MPLLRHNFSKHVGFNGILLMEINPNPSFRVPYLIASNTKLVLVVSSLI